MFDLTHIHPMLVHFPIALLTVGLLLDFLGNFLEREGLTQAGKWNLFIGSATLILAVATGLRKMERCGTRRMEIRMSLTSINLVISN